MLVNKVAESGVLVLNLEQYKPSIKIHPFDISSFLLHGFILKEKEFRLALKEFNWQELANTSVAIFCSTDAIVPPWAYMLIASYLQGIADVNFNEPAILEKQLWADSVKNRLEIAEFTDKRVIIKGCSDDIIPESAIVTATKLLLPVVKSLMFGEPCSTVPIYKSKVK